MDSFARGLVVSLRTRAYAVPTRSLREAYACSRGPLAEIWWNIRLKQEPYGPYSKKQVESEEHLGSSWHGQLVVSAAPLPLCSCSAGRVPRFARIDEYPWMNLVPLNIFEPFVDNIASILKHEIATPIMYEQLKYCTIKLSRTRTRNIWNLETCLRQSYAILTPAM